MSANTNGYISMSKSKQISLFINCIDIYFNLLNIPHFISHFYASFFSKVSQKRFK